MIALTSQEFLNILDKQQELLKQKKKRKPVLRVDLSYQDLTKIGMALDGLDLSNTNMEGTDISNMSCRRTIFSYAWMKNVIANGTIFNDAQLQHVHAEGMTARHAKFRHANIEMGRFVNADFRYSDWYRIRAAGANLSIANMTCMDIVHMHIPIVRDLDAKIAAHIDQPECALVQHTHHVSQTIHSRAGWAVHLAGRPGYLLERKLGTLTAGCLIYAVSCPFAPIPDILEETAVAIAAIRRAAGVSPPIQ